MPRKQHRDLAGQVFGKWTVKELYSKEKDKHMKWLCVCECGYEGPVNDDSLFHGKSLQCVSCKKKSMIKPDKELKSIRQEPTTKRFNKDGSKHKKFIDLTGQKFGKWEVKKWDDIAIGKNKWICECECGFTQSIVVTNLTLGKANSCRQCSFESKKAEVKNLLWSNVLYAAKTRKIEVLITKEYAFELLELQNRKCVLSGLDLTIAVSYYEHKRGGSTASLDRIDSSKGYVEGNVQWLHKEINRLKWDLTESRLLELAELLVNYHRIKKESIS